MSNKQFKIMMFLIAGVYVFISWFCFVNEAHKQPQHIQTNGVLVSQDDSKITVSVEDMRMLHAVVFSVAGDLSFETQICVTRLILNRVNSPNYPNTLDEVLADFDTNVRQSEFAGIDGQYAALLDGTHDVTHEAVVAGLSRRKNVIQLPENVTELSVLKLDDLEEWTSDCVDGLRFYYE